MKNKSCCNMRAYRRKQKSSVSNNVTNQVFFLSSYIKVFTIPSFIVQEGFECTANEDNMSYLFVANFILNHCNRENFFRIYPW